MRLVTAAAEQVLKFTTTVTVSAAPAAAPAADARFYAGRMADHLYAGQAFDGVVGTIRSLSQLAAASDFKATVDWGNGSVSAGVVRQVSLGRFEVTGRHTFAAAGRRTVSVFVTGPGGREEFAESIFVIDPPSPAKTV